MSIFSSIFGGGIKQKPQEIGKLDPSSILAQSSEYGKNILRVFGRAKLAGNVIWSQELREEKIVTTIKSGGFLGFGSSKQTTVTYFYYRTFAVAICVGEISDILKIWADNKIIYNIDTTDADTLAMSAALPIVKYLGSETQIPSSIMEAIDGAGNTPAYRRMAYVVFNNLPMKNYSSPNPNFNFEVQG